MSHAQRFEPGSSWNDPIDNSDTVASHEEIPTHEDNDTINIADTGQANGEVHSESPSCVPVEVPSTITMETELEWISKLGLAMSATLHMLEAARDNLNVLGQRMDRLQYKSRVFRQRLEAIDQQQQQQQQQEEQENLPNVKPVSLTEDGKNESDDLTDL